MKNNENPLIEEWNFYQANYENKHVKFAKLTFSEQDEPSVFENLNYGTRKREPKWLRDDDKMYPGIIDANPTAIMAGFSNTEISTDGENWEKVRDIAKNIVEKANNSRGN